MELAKFFFQLIFYYFSDFKNIFPAPDFKYFSISLANGLLALIIDFAISKNIIPDSFRKQNQFFSTLANAD